MWEWWQAPATEPKRNRWHSQRGDECHCPIEERSCLFAFSKAVGFALHGPGSQGEVCRPCASLEGFCEREALGFWRARVRGAVLGSGFAVGGRFAARQGLGKAAIIGLRGVFDKRHLRAMSAPRARSTSSGRSGSVPWVPSSLRRRLCAHGARRLRRRAGRLA